MALVFADLVKETTSTTGTGTLTLTGAVTNFQTFAAIGNANTTYYRIISGTSSEVGIGTYTLSGTTLSRDTVLYSTAGGVTKITVASGATVICTYPAEKVVILDGSGNATALGTPAAFVGTNITGTAIAFTSSNVTTNANLTGDITSVGNATTLTNAPVIAKVLTGYVSGAGTVAATDSILQAIQKLNGNNATNANLTGMVTSVGNATTVVTNANLTGAVTSVGNASSLGSFTSAQLATALTDESGTGANVFGTSPTLTTPTINSAQVPTISGTAPLYMCRAWVNFNGSGTVAIRASGNVSSITDNGVGDYTVNFTTAMPDANYSLSGSASRATIVEALSIAINNTTAPTTAAVRMRTDQNGFAVDSNYACISIFR